MGEGLARARADLADGRPWKARDRLRGVLGSDPLDQEALELLGDVHLAMGDPPEAGRWLYLTRREDEAALAAIAAFEARFPVYQLVRQVPAYAPPEAYPSAGATRLRKLADVARAEGIEWRPKVRRGKGHRDPQPRERASGQWTDELVGTVAVGALVAPWVAGIAWGAREALRLLRR